MADNKIRFFILTGSPGIGKTTVIKKILDRIGAKGVKPYGFYTEEVRNEHLREGFDVVTVDGQRGKLARDSTLLNTPAGFKVGKYGVLVHEFEKIALPTLKRSEERNLLVIDEIGKMEFFSQQFKTKIQEIFSPNSMFIVLATIPMKKSDPIIESIRNNNLAKVWTVTRENRNKLHEEITNELLPVLKFD